MVPESAIPTPTNTGVLYANPSVIGMPPKKAPYVLPILKLA